MGEFGSIDLNGKKPYYLQVKELIQARIDAGELIPGEKLPSEIELCNKMQVSRTVIRQALTELEHLGLVSKRKGKGSFISVDKSVLAYSLLMPDFLWATESAKPHTSVKILKKETLPANAQAAQVLKINEGEPVLQVLRMYYNDEEPIIQTKSQLPGFMTEYLSDEDLLSPLHYLDHVPAVMRFDHAQQTLEITYASKEDAKLLGISTGVPLLTVITVTMNQEDTPIEAYTTYLRGDRIRLRGTIFRYSKRDR